MADPWTEDFAALDERARQDLRPMAATRALRHQEPKAMRKFRQRPAFAVLVVLAVLLAAPLAYAVAHKVLVSIDPDKSAPEIEQDVKTQLDNAGMPAEVHAEKSQDGKLKLKIQATHQGSGSEIDIPEIHLTGPKDVVADQRTIRVNPTCQLSPEQLERLTQAVSSDEFIQASESGDLTDEERVAAIKDVLAHHGFHDVVVETDGGALSIKITAPPK